MIGTSKETSTTINFTFYTLEDANVGRVLHRFTGGLIRHRHCTLTVGNGTSSLSSGDSLCYNPFGEKTMTPGTEVGSIKPFLRISNEGL